MDKTPEYIKQCWEAIEIRVEHTWVEGDWFVGDDGKVACVGSDYFGVISHLKRFPEVKVPVMPDQDILFEKVSFAHKLPDLPDQIIDIPTIIFREYSHVAAIWLPRQDQLQAMVPGFVENGRWPIPTILRFADFSEDMANNPLKWTSPPKQSMEQLWLAFVMHEAYGKRWDSSKKEWVEE